MAHPETELLKVQNAIKNKKFDLSLLKKILPEEIKAISSFNHELPENPECDTFWILPPKRIQWILENNMIRIKYQQCFKLLTKREKEVLFWIVKGYSNPEIAELLFVSRSTIEQHRKNIRKKLELPSGYQLFRIAQAFSIIP